MSKPSSRGRWQRVVDARRQARLALGQDPDVADLFASAPKRKSASAQVPLIPPASQTRSETNEYVLTLGEAAARLGVSRGELETIIDAGKVEVLPMGLTRVIPTREVERLRAR